LEINETKFFLNPNQLRACGNVVDDVPKHFGGHSHSITCTEQNLSIPLDMRVVISYFTVHTPTQHELETCDYIILTSDDMWDLYSEHLQILEGKENNRHISIKMLQQISHEITNDLMFNLSQEKSYGEMQTKKQSLFVSKEHLTQNLAVPITVARDTVKATTQEFIRSAVHPIERRYRTKNAMLKYNRLQCKMYSDTFFSNSPSLLGNKCGQLFVTDFSYMRFVPMKNKSKAGFALQELIQEVGKPNQMHTDGAKQLTTGKWKEVCRDSNLKMSQTEKGSPWQNRTEAEIHELKRHVQRLLGRMKTSIILWDFCCQYAMGLRNRLARPLPLLHDHTPHEVITGNTPDISEYL
jgi:hypothetical protein